jgi:hypothetical protein
VAVLAGQNAVEQRYLGVATGALNFFKTLGGAFGAALFGAILLARVLRAASPMMLSTPRSLRVEGPEPPRTLSLTRPRSDPGAATGAQRAVLKASATAGERGEVTLGSRRVMASQAALTEAK